MRITLVISSMIAGGAERVLSLMANYWAKQGVEVTVISFSQVIPDFYTLHSKVKRVKLKILDELFWSPFSLLKQFKYFFELRREIKTL